MAASRTRNYTCVIYPDSAPDNLIELINGLLVPCVLSPLHDKDENPDGTPKKPHYHFMVCFEGVKTPEQAAELFDVLHGVVPPKSAVNSVRSMARYFCHMDNPEKHQYDVKDVRTFGGLDYMAIIGSAADKYTAIREMLRYCDENNILAYSDLLQYAAEHREDWFRALCDSCTMVLKEYLKSKSWKLDKERALQESNRIMEMEARFERQ